ncbi:TPA: hypothetical protein H1P55_004572 [Salmonella enterica]|uniref:Ribbon-helix-helix protein CopG domain-containing protein n=1 Tax=Leclercia barmai TaxID=2785629 RepID=A0ABS7S2C0_9ENTR|nr:hypothetical protein [Leclercia sp. EMC7]HAK0681074.1 hypothetical protein [Salmonella enterica]MBZ0060719.1 hypothetical protein [Leclercia sp. EMC7]HAK0806968.1 hypothetical protein [Salmonella enterica]HAK5862322.1 hypothetical protein [Salmonella enterica]HAK8112813.1 hypothetical protein [Salmonella enterica]
MKNVRMQFDLPEERLKELDSLMEKCGISTKKELFNYALTMLEWAVDESEHGHDIAAIDREKKEFYSLRMPILKRLNRASSAN